MCRSWEAACIQVHKRQAGLMLLVLMGWVGLGQRTEAQQGWTRGLQTAVAFPAEPTAVTSSVFQRSTQRTTSHRGAFCVVRLPPVDSPVESPVELPGGSPEPSVDTPGEPAEDSAEESSDDSPEETTWNLESLQQLALRSNPTLNLVGFQVQALRGQRVQAGLYPNPTFVYQATEVGLESDAGQHNLFLNQPIVVQEKIPLRQAVAARRVEEATQEQAAQRFRVRTAVRRQFFRVLAAQELRRIGQQLVEITKKSEETTQRLVEAEERSEVDALQAKIEANNALVQLRRFQANYQGAWRQLVAVIGQPDLPLRRLDGQIGQNLPQLDWETVLGQIISQSPQIQQAEIALRRAQAAIQLACAERVPDPTVSLGVGHDAAAENVIGHLQISWPLPIFNSNQGNLLAAQAQFNIAAENLQRIKLDLQRRLAQAMQQYTATRRQAELYREEILEDAERSLELIGQGYQEGQLSYLQLLTAQQTFFQTHVAYYQALQEAELALALIEGLLLDGALDPVPSAGGSSF